MKTQPQAVGINKGYADDRYFQIEDWHTSDYTIYANSVTGSDITGDGSVGSPYQTLERALNDIPLKPTWKPGIDLTGDFTITKDMLFYFYVNNIEINGKKSVASSHTATTVVGASKADGTVLTVAGAGWTPKEHVGKLVNFKSGAVNGRYGFIYDNDADTIWVTQNGSLYKVPVVGDTFDIMSIDTNVVIAKAGLPGTTLGMKSCRFKFIDCNLSGDALAVQSSWLYTYRCTMELSSAIGANASFLTIETTYVKGTGDIAWFNFQNTTTKLFNGTVIDGDGDKGIFTRDQCTIKLAGEVVVSNLDNNGIATLGSFWSAERDDSWFRFYDCVAGFTHGFWNNQDPGAVQASASNIMNLPPMYGNISGDYLIMSKAGDIYNIDPTSDVATNLGTNTGSVDNGVTEGYHDEETGTVIYGIKDIGSYNKPVSRRVATDTTVTKFDYYIGTTDTTAVRNHQLPDPATVIDKIFELKDESGGAGTNQINLLPFGAETFDGNSALAIASNYGVVKIKSNGTNWIILK